MHICGVNIGMKKVDGPIQKIYTKELDSKRGYYGKIGGTNCH
jgi:hypothetical protein